MGLKLEEVVGKKLTEAQFDEAAGEKDACYHKVKARYDVWPSAYASGALVKCREVGAKNWGNKSKGKKKEGVNETPQMAKQGQVGLLLKLANKQLQNVSSLHKKGKNKEAKVFFNNKVYSTLEYIHRAFDNVSESVNEGLDEGQKRRASDILRKFDMAYIRFSQEVRDVMKLMDKSTGNKTDSRIINKAYGKHLIPFDDIMQSWARGQQNNPKIDESVNEKRGTCWVGYKQVGMKDKGGRKVPNCVKEIYEIFYEEAGEGHGYTFEYINDGKLTEAEYQGRKVKLGKPMAGDAKKFKVYVKNPKDNVVKVNFGQGGKAKGGTMRIRKSNPKARKSFRARHNCDSPGPRHKARYWSCRKW